VLAAYDEPAPLSVVDRVLSLIYRWMLASPPTHAQQAGYDIAAADLESALAALQGITRDLKKIEEKMEAAGAPWTPGRWPEWP
jgi:hypothetical protein